MDFYKDTWYVLDEYFKTSYFLTKHHLDSYNDFVSNKLVNTIRVLNPFLTLKGKGTTNEHEINIYIGGKDGSNIYINKPMINDDEKPRLMYPNEARLKNLTYKSDIYAEILVEYSINGVKTPKNYGKLWIGSIPIMLHSNLCVLNNQPPQVLREMGECMYDQGGYFIIDGKEKVVVAQERIVTNKIFINKSKDVKYSYEGLIRCTSEENPLFPKTVKLYVFKDTAVARKTAEEDDEPVLVRGGGESGGEPSGESNRESNREASGETNGEPDGDGDDAAKSNAPANKHPNAIVITSPNISIPVPLFILFRALGVENDKDIIKLIVPNNDDPNTADIVDFIRFTVVHGSTIYSQQEAMTYLANFVEYKHVDNVRHILINDIFPNVGKDFRNKAMFLGFIVNKLVKVCLKINKESDRDSYIFKRVDVSGILIANLFRDYYNQFRQKVRAKVDNIYNYKGYMNQTKDISDIINEGNILQIFMGSIIEDGMKKSLKGSWGVNMVEDEQDPDDIKEGLVQDVSRISYLGFISHLRRVSTPMDPTSKIVAPHRLHPSQWGVMCPCESPDGGSIGLLKNFAIMCNVTFDNGTTEAMAALKKLGIVMLEDLDVKYVRSGSKVLVNNNWVGLHLEPHKLFRSLKLFKRTAILNIYTSISWDIIQNEIHILTESGRCCRPLYVVENGKLLIEKYIKKLKDGKLTWEELIYPTKGTNTHLTMDSAIATLEQHQSPIEFIDVEETNTSLIAMDATYLAQPMKHYTHCEIHPSTTFSVVTHNIPLANHNPGPRNVFSGAQGKQAIGCYATNFNDRIDTMSYVLHYPQKCLVNTRYCEYLNLNRVPNGENLIVALATYTGYNMEDSLIINGDSVKRGMFNLTYFKNVIEAEEEDKNEGYLMMFGNPNTYMEDKENPKTVLEPRWGDYGKLDVNGFPLLNRYIMEDDAVIGKLKLQSELVEGTSEQDILFGNKIKKEVYYDRSLIADKTISGIVDKVYLHNHTENLKTCKIRLRKMRLPELGDKCCCYDDDTQVLTNRGWVNFKALTLEDRVATLVKNGTTLKYQNPTEIQKYDFDGELYSVDSRDVNLRVTGNHRMYVRMDKTGDYTIKEAKDIFGVPVYYKKNVQILELDGESDVPEFEVVDGEIVGFKVGDEIFDIKQWLVFFAIWVSEGSIKEDQLRITTYHHWIKLALKEVCNKLGLLLDQSGVGERTWHLCHPALTKLLTAVQRMPGLPDWVWRLDKALARILLSTLVGTFVLKNYQFNLGTEMADDFQRLCLHAGYSTSTSADTMLQINGVCNEPLIAGKDSWIPYKGHVWCCTVPEGDGVLYVRRQGIPVWCGNSRHAQKGVIGMVLPQVNMPFTKDGIVPDVIINPHAIPSRMTIGHLLETLLGKVGSCQGTTIDGTPFNNNDYKEITKTLERDFNLEKHGNEIMYNGMTGQQMETSIFIGPIYYERLKHMVADKINYRQVKYRTIKESEPGKKQSQYVMKDAAVSAMTRQPTKGRANNGGLRIGEMEKDSILSHGMVGFLKESLMERSDKYNFYVTENGVVNNLNNTHDAAKISAPFAFKQMLHEVRTLSIKPILLREPIDEETTYEDDEVDAVHEDIQEGF